jgi:hypothetical protein
VTWPDERFGDVDVRVDLWYDAQWNDVTFYVDSPVRITRGLAAEASRGVAEPAMAELVLLNDDGRFTVGATKLTSGAANPLAGKIVRGTLLRVRVLYASGASTSTRLVGEVPRWPVVPDDRAGSAKVVVPVTAFGILRRLQQRDDVGESPLSRYYRSATTLGYWSLEDGPEKPGNGASFGSPVAGSRRMNVTGGTCGDRTDALAGSDPIPKLGTARLQATPQRSAYSTSTGNAWTLVAHCVFPTSGPAATCDLLRVTTSGTARDWYVQVLTDGTLQMVVGNNLGAALLIGGPYAAGVLGTNVKLRLATEISGSDTTWALSGLYEGSSVGFAIASGTIVGALNGRPTLVQVSDGDGGDIAVSHVAIIDGNLGVTFGAEAFAGHAGEAVSARVDRVATEAGVTSLEVPAVSTVLVGTQQRAPVVDLLRDAVACDGILFDQRTALAVTWRGFRSRVDPTEVTVPYADLAAPSRVQTDDSAAVNDCTVTRRGGATARVTVTSGPLGVTAVGRYPESVTLALARDSDAVQQASHRTVVGTWAGPRIPAVSVDVFLASSGVRTAILDGSIDIGTRLVVTGLPSALGPANLRQIVDGYVETIDRTGWDLTLHCSPAEPHDYVVLDDAVMGVLAPEGATLAAAITTTGATSMSVATPAGKPLWATFTSGRTIDLLVSGTEVVRATAIAGASSPQSFTIARAINGVTATHLVNATVELYLPRRLGL